MFGGGNFGINQPESKNSFSITFWCTFMLVKKRLISFFINKLYFTRLTKPSREILTMNRG